MGPARGGGIQICLVTVFGIAGSARVGVSARRARLGGCRPLVLGSDFFEKNIPKNGFLGGCLCRENRLFWEVFVEKMDCAGDKMKTIAVLRPHPCGALPICALQRAHTQSAMRVPRLNSPQCQIVSECPWYLKFFGRAGHKIIFPISILH